MESVDPTMEEFWKEELTDEIALKMKSYCSSRAPASDSRIFPSGITLPAKYMEFAAQIRHLELREDDVWVITFPKCGKYHNFTFQINYCYRFPTFVKV